MHQHPRPPPRTASPALSPKTNPTRTNNSREDVSSSMLNKYINSPGHNVNDLEDQNNLVPNPIGLNKDALKKLDQIVQVRSWHFNLANLFTNLKDQNFHTKAAILVLQSRINLPVVFTQDGTKKVNRWVCLYWMKIKMSSRIFC